MHFANITAFINQQYAHQHHLYRYSVNISTSSSRRSQFHLQNSKRRHTVHKIAAIKTLEYTIRYPPGTLKPQHKIKQISHLLSDKSVH
jgi:hypothetical protein